MGFIKSTITPQWLFWILQIGGWGGLWVFYMSLIAISGVTAPGAASGLAMTYGTGLVASSLLRLVYRQFTRTSRPLIVLVGAIIGLSAVGAQVWFWLGTLASLLASGPAEALGKLEWSEYLLAFYVQCPTLLIWSVLYFAVKFWFSWRSQKIRAEKADTLAQRAQLQMLRYQLNPHFLFNALNSIRALIDEDKENAKRMITELSKFLRYSLINTDMMNVSLRNELEALRHYFTIQKIRYGDRVEIDFDIDSAAEAIVVPGFLLHPLAENAIKYGMQTSENPLRIRIAAHRRDNVLEIIVSNTGKWVPFAADAADMPEGTGTSLANARQRLANAFPDNSCLNIEHGDGWVRVIITISKVKDFL